MNHQHEGKGGSYVVGENDVTLVERTRQVGEEPEPDEPAPAEASKTTRAAKAALSSPAAPAEQTSKE